MTHMMVPSSSEPTAINRAGCIWSVASTTVSMVAMKNMWWPVRKTYFRGVMRAMSRLTAKPPIITQATWAPNSAAAMETMASFVGTTPWAPVACRISSPNGVREAMTTFAPAPRIRKPEDGLQCAADDLAGALAQRDQADRGDDANQVGRDREDLGDDEVDDGHVRFLTSPTGSPWRSRRRP